MSATRELVDDLLDERNALRADMARVSAERDAAVKERDEAQAALRVCAPTVCGSNPVLPADRLGCGRPITLEPHIYRCTDCDTAFHKECLAKHCVSDLSAALAKVKALREAMRTALDDLNTQADEAEPGDPPSYFDLCALCGCTDKDPSGAIIHAAEQPCGTLAAALASEVPPPLDDRERQLVETGSDRVTACDSCGKTARRPWFRHAPRGWLFLRAFIKASGPPEDYVVMAVCSERCARAIWHDGPGPRLDEPTTQPTTRVALTTPTDKEKTR